MKSQSSKITPTEFKKINAKYKEYKQTNLKNENLLAFYKTKELAISVFKNWTLLLQGDEKAILKFNINDNFFKKKTFQSNEKIDGIIGMDEVGTGDYFGPIVTCSCYVTNESIDAIKKLGVDDSKKMDDNIIKLVAKQLKKIVHFQICVCNPITYNKLIKKFNNNNVIKAICHNDALSKLTQKLKNEKYKIVLDQFVERNHYYDYLEKAKIKSVHIDTIVVKAESKYLAVACASVLARDAFLTCMNDLSRKANIKLPFGSSNLNKIIEVGKKIIEKWKLEEFAKLHFDSITNKINN